MEINAHDWHEADWDCEICFAKVRSSKMSKHEAWHDLIASELLRLTTRTPKQQDK